MIQFFVPGIPRPGGSKRAFLNKHTGRIIVTEDCFMALVEGVGK